MSDNTYQVHKLYIDDKPIDLECSGSIKFASNNNINTMTVKIESPDIQHSSLMNKKVKLFLNAGSIDSVPIFSGYITAINPTDTHTSISCHDPRILISGKQGIKLDINDENNYDGYSLGAFLKETITEKVNNNETLIGLNMLNDTKPTYSLTNYRATTSIYDAAKSLINKVIDDSDFDNPLSYFFDILEGEDIAELIIKKDKSLDISSYTFSFIDGLEKYNYTERVPTNTYTYKGGTFTYTSTPTGRNNVTVQSDESRADARNLAIVQSQLDDLVKNEIQIMINKCYHIGMGTIVNLNVDDDSIRGNHRVVGKTITFGKNMTCRLQLNKKPINFSDYI